MSQSSYELLENTPNTLALLMSLVSKEIDPQGTAWPTVRKDLEAYQDFLGVMCSKMRRATANLLMKPKVASYLKGEEVTPEEEAEGAAVAALLNESLAEMATEEGWEDLRTNITPLADRPGAGAINPAVLAHLEASTADAASIQSGARERIEKFIDGLVQL